MKAQTMRVCVCVSQCFTLRITNGNSSSAISAPSQWSNRIILRFNHTASWAASQLILMYCIPGFNPIQNHSGWSLKCQLGLIPGIKYTSVTRRHFVLVFLVLFFLQRSWAQTGDLREMWNYHQPPHKSITVFDGEGLQRMYHTWFLLNFAVVN